MKCKICPSCKKEFFKNDLSNAAWIARKTCSRSCWSSFSCSKNIHTFFQRATIVPLGCWEFQGPRDKDGYGRHSSIAAHRHGYQLLFGPIEAGVMVLHRCDNPIWIRPSHLFLGTQLDNMRDKLAKGRHRSNAPKGEANHNSKLTECDVREIRRSILGVIALAGKFNIARTTVYAIKKGAAWTHVN